MPFSHLELRAVILVFTARCKLTGTSPKHSSNHHSTSLNGSHRRAVPRWIAHHRSLTNPFRMYKQLVLSKQLQRHQGKARPLGDQQPLSHCSPGANTNDKCEGTEADQTSFECSHRESQRKLGEFSQMSCKCCPDRIQMRKTAH